MQATDVVFSGTTVIGGESTALVFRDRNAHRENADPRVMSQPGPELPADHLA